MSSSTYKSFLQQCLFISQQLPSIKTPKNLNLFLYKPHPFASCKPNWQLFDSQRKSQMYYDRFNSAEPATPVTEGKEEEEYCQDVPLPNSIKHHMLYPSTPLLNTSASGKVMGFRIQVKGRKGSRSVKQVVSYGKLDTNNVGKSFVDFGKSVYVHKRGSTGIKVIIAYQ